MRTATAAAAARNATTIVARSGPGRALIAADRNRAVHHPGVRARLLVTALFALAAVVSALPAVLDFRSEFISTGLPGYGEAATGDHLQTSYRFWLVGHQLESGAEPWRDPYSYQPLVEPQVVLGGWPYGFPFWPLEALFGPVVAWNLLVLAVTFAACLFAYLWLRELDLPLAAAALGGLAFGIAPYRVVQSGGHLLGWIAVLVPLALWAFERSRRAESPRGAHAWGALSAAALVSIPLSGQLHLALGALPLVAVYAAVRYRLVPSLWAWGGAAVAVGAGLLAEATVIEGTTASEGRELAEVAAYSADPVDFLSRWRLHGLEQFVYLGWLTPALAVAGLVLLARRQRGLAIVLGIAALVPALLALGTNLPLYETLRDVFPPLRYPRVPGRFLPLATLALAALAAFACAWLLTRVREGRRVALGVVLIALVAADLLVFPLRSSAADPDNLAYAGLRSAAPGRVLEFPIFERGKGQFGSVYQYYTLQAQRERPTGYSLAPRRRSSSPTGSTGSTAAPGSPAIARSWRSSGSGSSSTTEGSTSSRARPAPGTGGRASSERGSGSSRVARWSTSGPRGPAAWPRRRRSRSPAGTSRCSATAGGTVPWSWTRERCGSTAAAGPSSRSRPTRPRG